MGYVLYELVIWISETINNARIEPLVDWVDSYERKDPLITFRVHSLSKTKGGIQLNIIETIK